MSKTIEDIISNATKIGYLVLLSLLIALTIKRYETENINYKTAIKLNEIVEVELRGESI